MISCSQAGTCGTTDNIAIAMGSSYWRLCSSQSESAPPRPLELGNNPRTAIRVRRCEQLGLGGVRLIARAFPALVAWDAWSILCAVLDLKLPERPSSPLATLLKNLILHRPSHHLTLATLNYDLVLEQAMLQLLNTGRFRYGEADPSTDPPTVEVLKLHGSLNWKEATPDFLPYVPNWGEREDGWLNVVCPLASGSRVEQPSLLLPTLFKQEISIDYQTEPRAKYYKNLWRVFAARLRSATALLTVGCSFPDTDRHLRT
jgi:hypothetical protein